MERFSCGSVTVVLLAALLTNKAGAQQPPEPIDISPDDGEIYYLINQHSGLQAEGVTQELRSFTNTAQRWAFTRNPGNGWQIRNTSTGSCLTSDPFFKPERVELRDCPLASFGGVWELIPSSNGYYSIRNKVTRLYLDVAEESTAAGARLAALPAPAETDQSKLWLLRPAYLRGVDNALLEKQESLRVSQNIPWWKDNGKAEDVLGIFKNHGVNMIRLRPTSAPPYVDPSVNGCYFNTCYAETEQQDLDLARRAKNLGMSIELSLLFDGGNSQGIPPAWSSDTLQQAQTDLYNYVKAEIERYRAAGVMPDLVAIGNEVDTGFLGSLGSPTGANFAPFAALQKSGMQAIQDAAADTALGPAIPAPLACIHTTPAWDLTSFFTLANQNGVPYDAICQSYYPFYHGPLTDAQAAAANPYSKPVEQDVLVNAANNLGKPIFIMETAEHYENGFDANDPWYPPSVANQRQYLLDLQNVMKTLPNQLGMGVEYWDAAGVNILAYGGPYYFNGGYPPDSIYIWNGLTLFNNGDSSGSSQPTDPNYSELLPGMDAVGNKLDPTMKYKLVSQYGSLLATGSLFAPPHALWLLPDCATTFHSEQWTIQSKGDGFFQIQNAAKRASVLDGSDPGNTRVAQPDNRPTQEWDVRSLGGGVFQIVNRASGLPVTLQGNALTFQITPTF